MTGCRFWPIVRSRAPMEGALLLRRAGPADAGAIARTLEAAFRPLASRYTPAAYAATVPPAGAIRARLRAAASWVAVAGGDVVGTVTARPTPAGVYVQSMAVVPAARGRGVGGRLMAEAVRFAEAQGAARLYLATTPFLHEAIRLYQARGFAFVPEGPHDLHGTPLRTMELRLPT